ncbi:hypothetical protein HYQ44_012661 [Verticillium longisporum]|nr:hypothetical protein HYQ44_012661 [Verticillium longisporum]
MLTHWMRGEPCWHCRGDWPSTPRHNLHVYMYYMVPISREGKVSEAGPSRRELISYSGGNLDWRGQVPALVFALSSFAGGGRGNYPPALHATKSNITHLLSRRSTISISTLET